MRYGDWYFRVNKNDNNIIIENNVKQLLYTESFKTDTDCNAIYSLFDDGNTIEELVNEDFELFIEKCEDDGHFQFPSEFWYQLRETMKPLYSEYYEYYYSHWLLTKEEQHDPK